jgi:hypothetical protein
MPALTPRQQATQWIEEAHARAQAKNCERHAYLIMRGIAGNIGVRRILCLLATIDNGEAPVISMKRAMFLANVHPKYFVKVFGCLREFGALLPDLSLPEEDARFELLVSSIEADIARFENEPDPVVAVEALWRRQCGDVVNPAIVSLIKSEEYH